MDLLQQDVSWETLKRALREAPIKIANLAEILDRSQAVTIQPQPIPLDIKIVLFGEAWLYYRLRELDPDFGDSSRCRRISRPPPIATMPIAVPASAAVFPAWRATMA